MTTPAAPEQASGWQRWQRWLLHDSHELVFVGLVLVTAMLRTGVSVARVDAGRQAFARSFPDPDPGVASWDVLSPAIAKLLGVTSIRPWILLHVGLLVVAGVVLVRLLQVRAPGGDHRVALVWISCSSVVAANAQWLGFYDVWMVLGGTLAVLGAGVPTALGAGLLLGASNAEQGLVALVCLALVAQLLAPSDDGGASRRRWWRRLGVAAAALVATRLSIMWWFESSGVEVATRAGQFGENLRYSLRSTLAWGTTGVFAWYGCAWVAVVRCIGLQRGARWSGVAAVAALVAIPGAATVLTADGTRVFASVSWPAYLFALLWTVRHEARLAAGARWLERGAPIVLPLSLLLPAIVTDADRTLPPWWWLAERWFP